MNKNVRTGIGLLCAAAFGGLLLVVGQVSEESDTSAALTGIGTAMLVILGGIGLLAVGLGVQRRD